MHWFNSQANYQAIHAVNQLDESSSSGKICSMWCFRLGWLDIPIGFVSFTQGFVTLLSTDVREIVGPGEICITASSVKNTLSTGNGPNVWARSSDQHKAWALWLELPQEIYDFSLFTHCPRRPVSLSEWRYFGGVRGCACGFSAVCVFCSHLE